MTARMVNPPTPAELGAAELAVRRYLRPTPVVAAPELAGAALLKLETLQPTGSFKVRGALAALTAAPADCEVVAASAGNHALGLAHAATLLGRSATVVVAETASPAKIERLRAFPIRLILHRDGCDAAERHALELVEEGAIFVSAYNDPHVIAGQRTVGVELEEQLDGPLTVLCPVGGGGLLAGVALWASERSDVRVVGVEVAASRALSAAVAAGRVVDVPIGETLADGMAGGIERGSITVEIAREHVEALVAVDEDELRSAIRALAFEQGLIVEGAGAAAAAAILAGKARDDRPGARLVAVATGRNITSTALLAALRQHAAT
jgi:threonine dehydratase